MSQSQLPYSLPLADDTSETSLQPQQNGVPGTYPGNNLSQSVYTNAYGPPIASIPSQPVLMEYSFDLIDPKKGVIQIAPASGFSGSRFRIEKAFLGGMKMFEETSVEGGPTTEKLLYVRKSPVIDNGDKLFDKTNGETIYFIKKDLFTTTKARHFMGPDRLDYVWKRMQNGLLMCFHYSTGTLVATFYEPLKGFAEPGKLFIHPGGAHMQALLTATCYILDRKAAWGRLQKRN